MTDTVDVLIVGAGASGAAVAWSLAETRMRIVCLEQGDWMNPLDYPSTGRDWEARAFSDMSISPNRRQRETDYPVNDADSPISVANFNAVGGSTILYAGHFPRFHPSDFRVKTLDGVADDWPIDYRTLEPFYAENDRMMGTSGLAGDPAYPPKEAVLPPVPMGKSGQAIARGFNKLGWHWWPSDTAIATQQYDGRAQCINLGACGSGCAQGAKASTDVTYWPHAVRAGVEVRTRCRVREITVNADGMASGVVYYDEDGVERHQAAEVVIVACNGVGTPRLLLNSTSGKFPNGLANSSGIVGKNLMFHPYASIQGVFDEPLDGYRGPGVCIWSQEFYETDAERGFVRGYTYEINRGRGPVRDGVDGHVLGPHSLGRRTPSRLPRPLQPHRRHGGHLRRPARGTQHRHAGSRARGRPRHSRAEDRLHALGEQPPNARPRGGAGNRGAEGGRRQGRRHRSAHRRRCGWHLMGTARMGMDPERSVVNEWGRAHDVRNLFIVDGSIFVTSAGVNPTRTIQALALYVADAMKKRLANLFD